MTITVFGKPPTRALRVTWMLEEMGLPYEVRPVNFAEKGSDTDFMAANPAGLLPAMTDGDVAMGESVAMMQYLAARYGPTPLAPAADAANHAKYLQFLHFGEASLAAPLNVVVASRFFAPDDQKANFGSTAALEMTLRRSVLVIDQLGKSPFMAGNEFTAADISVGYAFYVMEKLGIGERLDPRLKAYQSMLEQRPAFQRATAR
jgi:glutathione S-transferase